MPEYLAPGVFVEEVSYRAKSIEGVSTTTTGFVGPTRYGPIDIEPEIVTSLVEFERVYGGRQRLEFTDTGGKPIDNYMWNAVRAFFEEGGKRLYISRVYSPPAATTPAPTPTPPTPTPPTPTPPTPTPPTPTPPPTTAGPPAGAAHSANNSALDIRARFPGAAGNGRVTITLQLGPSRLDRTAVPPVLRGATDRDLVYIRFPDVGTGSSATADSRNDFYIATRDPVTREWSFSPVNPVTTGTGANVLAMTHLGAATGTSVRTVTATVTYESATGDLPTFAAAELPLDPLHASGGVPDSLFAYFAPEPASLSRSRSIPLVIVPGAAVNGLAVLTAIFAAYVPPSSTSPTMSANLTAPVATPTAAAGRSITLLLTSGSDGLVPTATSYEGAVDPLTDRATGLKAFEGIEDISIVAAPGSTRVNDIASRAVIGLLISHAERMQYRIAVIDSAKDQTISEVRALRALYDSSHAAFYYPWVRIIDPVTQQENHYPPSGFVAGIYARNDVERAVYKAPANEVVNLALGFEIMLNKAQQEVLNPEGINCFRYFEGRGMRLWGARTMSSDPEWKYVNLRRYFAFLERSIDKGTQWAVFEPNGERLWANVRRTIQDFLLDQWQTGALLGDKPEKAYFVKCDRSTMSQNDLDNGRLVCQVGVAALRPAEFVIFRIGQWTADFKA